MHGVTCHVLSVKCLEFSLCFVKSVFFHNKLLFFVVVVCCSYPDILYILEKENELLTSMDIDHPVRNSTNNTVTEEVKFPKKFPCEPRSISLSWKIYALRVRRS